MQLSLVIEFQNLVPTNVPKYFKMTKIAEFLNETIGKGKTNKEAAKLFDVSPSTINRYKNKQVLHQIENLFIEPQKKNKPQCLNP